MSFDTVLVIGPIIYFALLLGGIVAGIAIISAFLMRVSRFVIALRRKPWKQRLLGSNLLRLSFLFKSCGFWTLL